MKKEVYLDMRGVDITINITFVLHVMSMFEQINITFVLHVMSMLEQIKNSEEF